MTDTKRNLNDTELEALFAASRAEHVEAEPAFLARILADAEHVDAARVAKAEAQAQADARAKRSKRRRPALIAAAIAMLSGWPAVASVATATAGVFIGFAAPDGINMLTGGVVLPGEDVVYSVQDTLPVFCDLTAFYAGGE